MARREPLGAIEAAEIDIYRRFEALYRESNMVGVFLGLYGDSSAGRTAAARALVPGYPEGTKNPYGAARRLVERWWAAAKASGAVAPAPLRVQRATLRRIAAVVLSERGLVVRRMKSRWWISPDKWGTSRDTRMRDFRNRVYIRPAAMRRLYEREARRPDLLAYFSEAYLGAWDGPADGLAYDIQILDMRVGPPKKGRRA